MPPNKEKVMSNKQYPLIRDIKRKPDKDKDGSKNYGKPCVICGVSTCGEKWVQFSFMRGEDEPIRVCAEHWKTPNDEIIKAGFNYQFV